MKVKKGDFVIWKGYLMKVSIAKQRSKLAKLLRVNTSKCPYPYFWVNFSEIQNIVNDNPVQP